MKGPMRGAFLVISNLMAVLYCLDSWKRVADLRKHGTPVGTFEHFQVWIWTALLFFWLAIDVIVWKRRKRGHETEETRY